MAMIHEIQESLQRLPPAFQAEVLDFVEYLLIKAEREISHHEKQEWSRLSLAHALRDMDEEPSLYSLSDLKVVF